MKQKIINKRRIFQITNNIKNGVNKRNCVHEVCEEPYLKICDTIAVNRFIRADGYIVEMLEQSGVYEFWITHKNCGVKDYMFGLPIEQQSAKEAIAIMLNNADTYINWYKEDYRDED